MNYILGAFIYLPNGDTLSYFTGKSGVKGISTNADEKSVRIIYDNAGEIYDEYVGFPYYISRKKVKP